MILSILIPTLKCRDHQLQNLLNTIHAQKADGIDVIVYSDEGQKSVGTKRNWLLKQASGDYIVFIDDDDMISPDYISKVLAALETKPDVVGMTGIYTVDGKNPKKFIHSLRYKVWSETSEAYLRNPNHLNPVKRNIAVEVGFPEINCGEDHDYSKRLLKYLGSEVFIPEPIYFYQFSTKNTATQKPK